MVFERIGADCRIFLLLVIFSVYAVNDGGLKLSRRIVCILALTTYFDLRDNTGVWSWRRHHVHKGFLSILLPGRGGSTITINMFSPHDHSLAFYRAPFVHTYSLLANTSPAAFRVDGDRRDCLVGVTVLSNFLMWSLAREFYWLLVNGSAPLQFLFLVSSLYRLDTDLSMMQGTQIVLEAKFWPGTPLYPSCLPHSLLCLLMNA